MMGTGGSTGGTQTTGGAGPTGGVATGGVATGGVATGGVATGGVATGGTQSGGVSTGGVATGGTQSGGVSTGGVATGGASTGGASTDTCPGADQSGAANIDINTEYQTIDGYGGANIPGWIADLTSAQADTAFGNGSGQIGLTIIRLRIPPDGNFSAQVATAARASSHGAKVMATPWTPPANMKTNSNTIGGRLNTGSYGAYADHLLSFRDYMESNGVPLYAISVQNEPDITVEYESCDWNSSEFISWLTGHGSKFGETLVMVAESFNFNRTLTDPILNDAAAEAQVDIVAGHIYGNGLSDYPLARSKGKKVWMTEHYTESANSANAWPLALDVGKELHDCMAANFNAYVWWYIRRSYGLITEDGNVSKRGYIMAQYSKFVRPGYVRVAASAPSSSNVFVTAYKSGSQVAIVAVNMSSSSQTVTLNVRNVCVSSFTKYTTSGSKNLNDDGTVTLTNNSASVGLDAQSVTTFVSG